MREKVKRTISILLMVAMVFSYVIVSDTHFASADYPSLPNFLYDLYYGRAWWDWIDDVEEITLDLGVGIGTKTIPLEKVLHVDGRAHLYIDQLLAEYGLRSGRYNINMTVKKAQHIDWKQSFVCNYTSSQPILDPPHPKWDGLKVCWDPVEHATTYDISITSGTRVIWKAVDIPDDQWEDSTFFLLKESCIPYAYNYQGLNDDSVVTCWVRAKDSFGNYLASDCSYTEDITLKQLASKTYKSPERTSGTISIANPFPMPNVWLDYSLSGDIANISSSQINII